MTTTREITAIYLDNQATTPVLPQVISAMMPHFAESYGNPHSGDHWFGWQAKKAVDKSRGQIAEFLSADSDEVFFTSGATESNNLAFQGLLKTLSAQNKTKIVVSEFEHKCVLECAYAARDLGFTITTVTPDSEGFVSPDALKKVMDDSVGLVSIMTVNNEIGTIQPIPELTDIAHSHDAYFHTDAAQGAIFLDLDVRKSNVDLLSISGHKIHGPKGIGALFIHRQIQDKISPLLHGGGQEGGLRSGTLPTMLAVGFGEACEIIGRDRSKNYQHLADLRNSFLTLLQGAYRNVQVNGSLERRHPGNLNLRFPNFDAHSLIQMLQPQLAASTGSACTSGTPQPSYVLRSIGLSREEAQSSLRFSFGLTNTLSEIERAVEYLQDALKEDDLRAIA